MMNSISPAQLKQLNSTTVRLYRILLRECRILQRSSGSLIHGCLPPLSSPITTTITTKEDKFLLLQPQLDPRDWGRARLFHSSILSSAHAPKSTIILEFLDQFRESFHGMNFSSPSASVSSSSSPSASSASASSASSPHTTISLVEDESVLVSSSDILDTIRSTFRNTTLSSDQISSLDDILYHHRRAIDATRILQMQVKLSERTCITYDSKRGIRVIATSRCIGRATKSPMSAMKGEINNRFAYRIRVENTGIIETEIMDEKSKDKDTNATTKGPGQPVQLLGRFWSIEENGDGASEPVVVKAPTTGAVGHLPVIHPGQIFEYMSGCEIGTQTGYLSGCFYMAQVDDDTESAMVGDAVKALEWDEEDKFEMPIGPFHLISEGGDDNKNNNGGSSSSSSTSTSSAHKNGK